MNYKITFHFPNLGRPVAMQSNIMFDGLLAYAYHQEHAPEEQKGIGRLSFSEGQFDFSGLPLVQHERGYYMASWLFFDRDAAYEQVHTFLKKWDEESDHMVHLGKTNGKVYIDRGEYKTTQIPVRVFTMRRCWFYFQSRDVEQVRALIQAHIHGIGKKAARGYGDFSHFDIEEMPDDIFAREIVRPIPVSETDLQNLQPGQKIAYHAWKFPYWLPENFTYCRVE